MSVFKKQSDLFFKKGKLKYFILANVSKDFVFITRIKLLPDIKKILPLAHCETPDILLLLQSLEAHPKSPHCPWWSLLQPPYH